MIEPVGAHGGMDYYDTGLCDGLALANIKPILYTSKPILLKMNEIVDVRLFYTAVFGDSPVAFRGALYLWATMRSLFHAKLNGAKVCHLHFFHVGILELFNVIVARMLGLKIVITVHDVQSFVEELSWPFFANFSYFIAHHLVVHNKSSKDELIHVYNVMSNKVSVIMSGNYSHVVRPLPDRNETCVRFGVPAAAKVILFFGQIKKVKGLDILIKAFGIMHEVLPDTHLIIAGRPWKEDLDIYKDMIDDNENRQYVHPFFQFIPDSELPSFFSVADIIVLPYRRIYQSAVILMAMSYGKAVLASDLEAMKEIIKDEDNGYLFLSEDAQALAKKMIKVLSDESGLRLVAKRGLEFVEKEYSWEQVGRETSICYQKVVNGL